MLECVNMKKFFHQDKVLVGIVAGLGSELVVALLLTVGLLIANEPIGDHIRWYAGMFLPPLLVLRYYSKQKQWLRVTRTLIVVLFVTFIAFMVYLLKAGIIVYK